MKVGSGESQFDDLFTAILSTRKPILLSTGLSNMSEIDRAVELFNREDVEFCLLQCSTQYPTPLEEVGLNVMCDYRARYNS